MVAWTPLRDSRKSAGLQCSFNIFKELVTRQIKIKQTGNLIEPENSRVYRFLCAIICPMIFDE
jgi:hypothetical protein